MTFGKEQKTKKSHTIDLRKKQSFFDTLRKKKTHKDDDILKCKICFKKIVDKPIFCNQYKTKTRLCNAGPFCSEKCWDKHIKQAKHY